MNKKAQISVYFPSPGRNGYLHFCVNYRNIIELIINILNDANHYKT
jgi:hypothetical protein